jgi:hypothetical protein
MPVHSWLINYAVPSYGGSLAISAWIIYFRVELVAILVSIQDNITQAYSKFQFKPLWVTFNENIITDYVCDVHVCIPFLSIVT